MTFTKKEKHEHKFDEKVTTTVLPHKKSRQSFRDILKQRKCKCGAIETYELERKEL